jgi:hypothetical protein
MTDGIDDVDKAIAEDPNLGKGNGPSIAAAAAAGGVGSGLKPVGREPFWPGAVAPPVPGTDRGRGQGRAANRPPALRPTSTCR